MAKADFGTRWRNLHRDCLAVLVQYAHARLFNRYRTHDSGLGGIAHPVVSKNLIRAPIEGGGHQEVIMRKLVVSTLVSLDGVIQCFSDKSSGDYGKRR